MLLLSRDFLLLRLLRRSLGRRLSPGPGPSLSLTRAAAPQPRLAAAMADPKYADLPGIVSTGLASAPQDRAPDLLRTPTRHQPVTPPACSPSSVPGAPTARSQAGRGIFWTPPIQLGRAVGRLTRPLFRQSPASRPRNRLGALTTCVRVFLPSMSTLPVSPQIFP